MNFFYQLDVWESMLPFFEMGGMGKGKGVGTGRGVCGMGRGMNEWVGGWVEQKKLAEFPAKKFPVWFSACSNSYVYALFLFIFSDLWKIMSFAFFQC